jgi:hypothetical protein
LHRLSISLPFAPQARVQFEEAKAGLIRDLKMVHESKPLSDLLCKAELDFAQIEMADKQLQIARLKAYILHQSLGCLERDGNYLPSAILRCQ